MKIILITGASSGIGKEFTFQLDQGLRGDYEFWLVGRNKESLRELSKILIHNSRTFSIDLTDAEELRELEETVLQSNAKICMLIASAGVGYSGPLHFLANFEVQNMIRLNCEALTTLVRYMLPYMAPNGRIILMSSAAAFLPQPGFAVYAASKAYVLSFSRALSAELKDKNVYVTAVCPGPVDTPFLAKAAKTGEAPAYKKYFTAKPEDVVAKALRDSMHKRSISVYGNSIKALRILSKLIPHEVFLTIMGGFSK